MTCAAHTLAQADGSPNAQEQEQPTAASEAPTSAEQTAGPVPTEDNPGASKPTADAAPQSATPSADAATQPGRPALSRLDDYAREIARIETEQGAWGLGLSEQLAGLGRGLQLRGRHREAIDVFDRAIHVSRINNGLYDLSQVPLVEGQVKSYAARGEWNKVHERNEYLYWVHQRNYGDDDPRMLPVIDRLGTWALNDYALHRRSRSTAQLMNAHNWFEHATDIIGQNFGENDLRMVDPLRGLVLSNWFFRTYRAGGVSQRQKDLRAREIGGTELNTQQWNSALAGGPVQTGVYYPNDNRSPQLARYIRNSYAGGKEALNRMVEIYSNNPDAPPGAAAGARVELGDWYMLFNRWQSATDEYEQAYSELAADEATRGKLDKYFGRPVALPDIELLEADEPTDSGAEAPLEEVDTSEAGPRPYVLVSFDVTRYGEATNIDILDSHPEDSVGNRVKVKRSLENSRFRPRFVDGEPVTTEGLMQRYLFADQ